MASLNLNLGRTLGKNVSRVLFYTKPLLPGLEMVQILVTEQFFFFVRFVDNPLHHLQLYCSNSLMCWEISFQLA